MHIRSCQMMVIEARKIAYIIYLQPDFGKLTKLSQLGFQEIPILSIEATMVLSC